MISPIYPKRHPGYVRGCKRLSFGIGKLVKHLSALAHLSAPRLCGVYGMVSTATLVLELARSLVVTVGGSGSEFCAKMLSAKSPSSG